MLILVGTLAYVATAAAFYTIITKTAPIMNEESHANTVLTLLECGSEQEQRQSA